MCDRETEQSAMTATGGKTPLNRRDFTGLTTAGVIAAMFPASLAASEDVVEARVKVNMADGVCECYFAHPKEGKHPAILVWPDIFGPRPAYDAMARRLAAEGYAVLLVNAFYRDTKLPVVGPDETMSDPDVFSRLIGMMNNLDQDATMKDAKDYFAFLDAQPAVDTSRKAGTSGYCMGGRLIIRTAAALPDRVGAAASFHGANMVTDQPDSAHLLIPGSKAAVLHALAEDDDKKDPEEKIVLAQTYAEAGLDAEIEVYEGTLHGWCPPDSPVYNEAQAERAWARMLILFERELG